MHRPTAEAFNIYTSSGLASAHLRDRLGEVAPTALIAVTYRLFATVEHVWKRQRIELFLNQQGPHGHHRRGLTGEIFQQHIGCQRGVFLVCRLHATDEAPVPQVERQSWRASPALRDNVSFWKPCPKALQIHRGQQGVERQSGTCFLDKAGFEVHQIKGITDLQDPVKLLLRHDFSMRAPARTWGSAGKPRLRHGGECVGMYVAEKSAVGRIRYRRFITAQMRGNSVGYGGVAGNITTWFRAIAHQARCVSQKKPHPTNDWLLQSLCHGAPLCMHYVHP